MVVVLYAVTAVYFAGVMVRLMLTLTPVVCILAAIAFSVTLDNYLVDEKPVTPPDEEKPPNEEQPERKNKKEPNNDKVAVDLWHNYSFIACSFVGILYPVRIFID